MTVYMTCRTLSRIRKSFLAKSFSLLLLSKDEHDLPGDVLRSEIYAEKISSFSVYAACEVSKYLGFHRLVQIVKLLLKNRIVPTDTQ